MQYLPYTTHYNLATLLLIIVIHVTWFNSMTSIEPTFGSISTSYQLFNDSAVAIFASSLFQSFVTC